MSQLVLVEMSVAKTELGFERITGESLTCLASYADIDLELYRVRQYEYHPEYGATLYEIIVDWGDIVTIGPRPGKLGDALHRPTLSIALTEMRRRYEQATGTTCTVVRHEGRITRCSFKPKGEYQDPPTTLDWLSAELIPIDAV